MSIQVCSGPYWISKEDKFVFDLLKSKKNKKKNLSLLDKFVFDLLKSLKQK